MKNNDHDKRRSVEVSRSQTYEGESCVVCGNKGVHQEVQLFDVPWWALLVTGVSQRNRTRYSTSERDLIKEVLVQLVVCKNHEGSASATIGNIWAMIGLGVFLTGMTLLCAVIFIDLKIGIAIGLLVGWAWVFYSYFRLSDRIRLTGVTEDLVSLENVHPKAAREISSEAREISSEE